MTKTKSGIGFAERLSCLAKAFFTGAIVGAFPAFFLMCGGMAVIGMNKHVRERDSIGTPEESARLYERDETIVAALGLGIIGFAAAGFAIGEAIELSRRTNECAGSGKITAAPAKDDLPRTVPAVRQSSPQDSPYYWLPALAQALLIPTVFVTLVCAQCSRKQTAGTPDQSGIRLAPPSLAVPFAR